MSKTVSIKGTVEDIIYYNEDNGYVVFNLYTKDIEYVCVGTIFDLYSGEVLNITGKIVVHPSYGEQISIATYNKSEPTAIEDIEKYLGSGVIKGIGSKLAKRIVDKFGKDTFRIIETKPGKLAEISGITSKKANSIARSYNDQIQLKNTMMALNEFGLTPNLSTKIYKRYKEKSVEIVRTNPYRLADDIFGVGFKTADSIAQKLGIEKTSIFRIKSGIKYLLNQYVNDGHVFVNKDVFIQHSCNFLVIEEKLINDAILELQIENGIRQEKTQNGEIIYLAPLFYAENNSAKRLMALTLERFDTKIISFNDEIEKIEKENNIKLADKQKEAVNECLKNGVTVITGGPGTGKTTTIKAIISLFVKAGKEVILAAPTGRAAKKMNEATGMTAQTIHRLLEISYLNQDSVNQQFERNEENPIDADVIIIDEASMVDILLFNSLLKAIRYGSRLILVGDVNQLPSVGPGNVLKDIINSGCINVVFLNEIFRQAQKSAIVMNAHRINSGEEPVANEKGTDFFFMKLLNADKVPDLITELLLRRLPKFTNIRNFNDYQVLTPMRKSVLGSISLNKYLQDKLNPKKEGKDEIELRTNIFRQGDKIMQIKNNYNITWAVYSDNGIVAERGAGVFNGDMGAIKEIDKEQSTVMVKFDDGKVVEYEYSQLDEIELAYAITIHKSQGSEYPVIIIPIVSGPTMLMTRNLIYTGITRAKSLVVLLGSMETLKFMIANKREVERNSGLSEKLIKISSIYSSTND